MPDPMRADGVLHEADPTSGDIGTFYRERHIDANTLIIAFSSLGVDDPDKPFEFSGLTQRDDCSVLLVRDVGTTWYHDVPGIDGGLNGLGDFLAERTRRYRRIVCLGFSMGGYAALFYGRLLGADVTLAFAPQTTLRLDTLSEIGDHRWTGLLESLAALTTSKRHLDLQPLFDDTRHVARGQTAALYVGGSGDPWDCMHAERLSAYGEVVPLGDASFAHGALVVGLRESGLLRAMIDMAVRHGRYLPGVRESYEDWQARNAHTITIDVAGATLAQNGRLNFSGVLSSCGLEALELHRDARFPVRLGARVWPTARTGLHGREFRYDFPDTVLETGTDHRFAFDVDLSGLAAGSYDLVVALVREGRFWFDDVGFASAELSFSSDPFLLMASQAQ